MMTRKHYRAVAAALREELRYADLPARVGIMNAALALCQVFAADNARFDRNKFIDAVRGESHR